MLVESLSQNNSDRIFPQVPIIFILKSSNKPLNLENCENLRRKLKKTMN